jgi:hypothetical protein
VPRIRANDQHFSVPLDHAAAVTHGFHGRSDLHKKRRQATAKRGSAATFYRSKRAFSRDSGA